jgi:ribonucleoside-diphosphate reductase beta chain
MFEREYYKPFQFDWAYRAYKTQQQMHWSPEEVPMNSDAKDWAVTLTDSERAFLSNIFTFFTQADVDVAGGYNDVFLPYFKAPELRMMMNSFAAMEAVHIDAYSKLIETVGMPDNQYQKFFEHKEMLDKHDFLDQFKHGHLIEDKLLALAAFAAFTEGLQLFASFVMLLNFQRFNKMKGMCQIVAWSIRDETLHVEGMTKLFNEFREHAALDKFKESDVSARIRWVCAESVRLEDAFINLVFKDYEIQGLHPLEVKQYIRYIADIRMMQLGEPRVYNITKNPLPWVDELVAGHEHTNFFENRATSYAKASSTGEWGDVWDQIVAV